MGMPLGNANQTIRHNGIAWEGNSVIENDGGKATINGQVRVNDGTQGANKVLTSDAQGNASWQAGGGGGDPDAIHDNVASEIHAIASKAVPVAADELVIEDSAAGFAKKRATLGSLPAGGGGGNCSMKVGTYIGNGADNRNIDIGVNLAAKTYVFIQIKGLGSSYRNIGRPEYGQGDSSWNYYTATDEADWIQGLTATGFQIGANTHVNQSSQLYRFIVWWVD